MTDPQFPSSQQPGQPGAQPPVGRQPQQPQAPYAPGYAPPQQPYAVYPPAQGFPGAPQARMNGLAVFAFISSFFIGLLGLILSFVAASQIGRDGTRGKGLAIAAMIIGGVVTILQLILGVFLAVFLIMGGVLFSTAMQSDDLVRELERSTQQTDWAPANMGSGGAVFLSPDEVVETPALARIEDREAYRPGAADPVHVTIYVDYMCPACGAFEQESGPALEEMLDAGDITLEVYPISFLDSMSQGTDYSTRAANLFACVVDQQPEYAFPLHERLLNADVQPKEGASGLDDQQLLSQASTAGALVDRDLIDCVEGLGFGGFVSENTQDVLSGQGILGLNPGEKITGGTGNGSAGAAQRLYSTPTVVVDGKEWIGSEDGDLEAYLEKEIAEAR